MKFDEIILIIWIIERSFFLIALTKWLTGVTPGVSDGNER
jgi:hypothetical protein